MAYNNNSNHKQYPVGQHITTMRVCLLTEIVIYIEEACYMSVSGIFARLTALFSYICNVKSTVVAGWLFWYIHLSLSTVCYRRNHC